MIFSWKQRKPQANRHRDADSTRCDVFEENSFKHAKMTPNFTDPHCSISSLEKVLQTHQTLEKHFFVLTYLSSNNMPVLSSTRVSSEEFFLQNNDVSLLHNAMRSSTVGQPGWFSPILIFILHRLHLHGFPLREEVPTEFHGVPRNRTELVRMVLSLYGYLAW